VGHTQPIGVITVFRHYRLETRNKGRNLEREGNLRGGKLERSKES
jgi:hypothetical protein